MPDPLKTSVDGIHVHTPTKYLNTRSENASVHHIQHDLVVLPPAPAVQRRTGGGESPIPVSCATTPITHGCYDMTSFSLPFRDGGGVRLGKLNVIAPPRGAHVPNRRVPLSAVGDAIPLDDNEMRFGEGNGLTMGVEVCDKSLDGDGCDSDCDRDSPWLASVSKNSTHRRENDWRKRSSGEHHQANKPKARTSVSSVFSSSRFLLLLGDPNPQNPEVPFPVEPALGVGPEPLIRPAFSLSASPHPRMVPSNPNISNLFGSARGVDRKESRTLLTSRLSTLVSEDDFRRRRRASMRCSFMITANEIQVSKSQRRR